MAKLSYGNDPIRQSYLRPKKPDASFPTAKKFSANVPRTVSVTAWLDNDQSQQP